MFILVCYDVPSHRTQVYKKCLQKFVERGQDSVFWGTLVRSRCLALQKELAMIYEDGDAVWLFLSENPHNVQEWSLDLDDRGSAVFRMKSAVDKRSSVV